MLQLFKNRSISSLNSTDFFQDFDWEWNFDSAQLLAALLCGIVFYTYLTFYHSRVVALILTKLINRFVFKGSSNAYFQFGSFSLSLLSGKIIFRDVIYSDHNLTFRTQDGVMYFRFWLPYKKSLEGARTSKIATDLRLIPASKCRFSLHLNDVECHVYNWLERYVRIDQIFNLHNFSPTDRERLLIEWDESAMSDHFLEKFYLRRLVPVVNITISSAKFSFGNKFVPSTMTVEYENLHSNYLTTKASNNLDLFMHVLKGSCENVKISLVKTPDYLKSGHNAGTEYEKPPRTMGQGFEVMQTANLTFYYYQDEVAIVPLDRSRLHYVTDDVQALWGVNFALGKNTVISYGPWADAQRRMLHKFFYPDEYQIAPMTPRPGPGRKRLHTKLEVKANLLHDATFDLLFMRDDIPNAIHVNCVKGSWGELSIPWRIEENGCAIAIQGQLLMIESSTSMEYRRFFTGETLSFSVLLAYPRAWSDHHCWEFMFKSSKARLSLLYAHKEFLQDLILEWIKDSGFDDQSHFVPFTYSFDVKVDGLQLTLPCNDKNWIDTSSQAEENCHLAVEASSIALNFCLPFLKFNQPLYDIKLWANGEKLGVKFFLPDQHLLKHELQALYQASGQLNEPTFLKKGSDGWFDCWSAPAGTLSLSYAYHAFIIGREVYEPKISLNSVDQRLFDIDTLQPDFCSIDVEVSSSTVYLSAILINFIFLMKSNYFGECQIFTDILTYAEQHLKNLYGKFPKKEDFTTSEKTVDLREFRQLDVKLGLSLKNIKAYCLTHMLDAEAVSPLITAEEFVLEIDKRFKECLIQLSISPVLGLMSRNSVFHGVDQESFGTRLALSAFQFRAHGLFSAQKLPIDAPAAEYAWMMEILLGKIDGRTNPSDLCSILSFVQILIEQLISQEDVLVYPHNLDMCQHMRPRLLCPESHQMFQSGTVANPTEITIGKLCDTETDLKYRMLRVAVDCIDLFMDDKEKSALKLSADTARFSTCTEHLPGGKEGASLSIPNITCLFLTKVDDPNQSIWLECGRLQLHKPNIEITAPWVPEKRNRRQTFMQLHDTVSNRLRLQYPGSRQPFQCVCRGNGEFYRGNSIGRFFDCRHSFEEDEKYKTDQYQKQLTVYESRGSATFFATSSSSSLSNYNDAFGRSLLKPNEPALKCYIESKIPAPFNEFSGFETKKQKSSSPVEESHLVESIQDSESDKFYDTNAGSASTDSNRKINNGKAGTATRKASDDASFTSATSKMLFQKVGTSAYAKYLRSHSVQFASFNDLLREKEHGFIFDSFAPRINLCSYGINDVKLVTESQNLIFSRGDSSALKPKLNFSSQHNFDETAFGESCVDFTGDKISLEIFINCKVSFFMTPLCLEVLSTLLKSSRLDEHLTHPLRLSRNTFSSCSSRHHKQILVDKFLPVKLKKFEADDSNSQCHDNFIETCPAGFSLPPVIRVKVNIPVLDFSMFQLGLYDAQVVVTRENPYAGSILLAQSKMIDFDGCLMNDLEKVSKSQLGVLPETRTGTDIKFCKQRLNINGDWNQLHLQSSRLVPNSCAEPASYLPSALNHNFSNLRYAASTECDFRPSIVAEANAKHLTLKVKAKLSGSTKNLSDMILGGTSTVGLDETTDISIMEASLDNISIKCGLGIQSDASCNAWILYDLFTPALNSWMISLDYAFNEIKNLIKDCNLRRKISWLYLMTEAMDSQTSGGTKSKFENARIYKDLIQNCPSCQLCLCLTRFGTSVHFANLKSLKNVREMVQNDVAINKALVSLLGHWREILAAENLVRLQISRAPKLALKRTVSSNVVLEHSVETSSAEKRDKKPETVVLQIDTINQTAKVSMGVGSKNLEKQISTLERQPEMDTEPKTLRKVHSTGAGLSGKGNTSTKRRYGSTRASHASKSSLLKHHGSLLSSQPSRPSKSSGSDKPSARSADAENKEDLYTWMAKQQELDRNMNKREDSFRLRGKGVFGSTSATKLFINPFELSLDVFFEPFYNLESLNDFPGSFLPIFLLGNRLKSTFSVQTSEIGLVEPKVQYTGQTKTFKNITFIDRPLFIAESCTMNSLATFSIAQEECKVENPKRTAGGKDLKDVRKEHVILKVNQELCYDFDVKNCSAMAGFTFLAFLNEMAAIGRSVADVVAQLDENENNVHKDSGGTSESNNKEFESSNLISSATSPIKPEDNLITETSSDWCTKLQAILRDKKVVRRNHNLSGGSSSGGNHNQKRRLDDFMGRKPTAMVFGPNSKNIKDILFITIVNGSSTFNAVELTAVFTELFLNASIDQLTFGHAMSFEKYSQTAVQVDKSDSINPVVMNCSFDLNWNRVDAKVSEFRRRLPFNDADPSASQVFSASIIRDSARLVEMIVNKSHGSLKIDSQPVLNDPDESKGKPVEDGFVRQLKVEIGAIVVDIPLDPGVIHEVVIRGQKKFSERFTLLTAPQIYEESIQQKRRTVPAVQGMYCRPVKPSGDAWYFTAVRFNLSTSTVEIKAALLPSLRGTYSLECIRGRGSTGHDSDFTLELPSHGILFDVRELVEEADGQAGEVAPQVDVKLPALSARGSYVHVTEEEREKATGNLVIREGGYLRIEVQIGALKHTLTTDRLSQYLFIQEAFMRELVDVLQKIMGEKRNSSETKTSHSHTGGGGITPSPSRSQPSFPAAHSLLFSIDFQLESMQITATTPTSTAVRLESDKAKFQLSNRFLQKSTKSDNYERVFAVADINLNVSLGQLVKNAMYEELKPDFQRFAMFSTQISVRNIASNDWPNGSEVEQSQTYLMNLKRPLLFVQPSAVDKALLLWMNYSKTYEYWNEQRAKIRPKRGYRHVPPLKSSMRQASVFDQLTHQTLTPGSGPSYFQVTIDDGLYLVMPLHTSHHHLGYSSRTALEGGNPALLISLEKTSIAVCNSDCLVSKGKFKGFRVSLVEDFDASIDAWRPHSTDGFRPAVEAQIQQLQVPPNNGSQQTSGVFNHFATNNMNACYVSWGTYDICSKTQNMSGAQNTDQQAKWLLSIDWQMKGMDMNFNPKIWKLCSYLVSTLTSFVGDTYMDTPLDETVASPPFSPQNTPKNVKPETSDQADISTRRPVSVQFLSTHQDHSVMRDAVKLPSDKATLEAQMRRQARLVTEMLQSNASEDTIEIERRKLQRYEAALYAGFKQTMADKIRYRGHRTTSTLRDHSGLPAPHLPSPELERPFKDQLTEPVQGLSSLSPNYPRRYSDFARRPSPKRLVRVQAIDESPSQTNSDSASPDLSEKDQSGGRVSKVADPKSTPRNFAAQLSQAHSVDLYLDLKIDIDQGQCTFRSIPSKSSTTDSLRGSFASRVSSRNRLVPSMSSNRLRGVAGAAPVSSTQTVFALPSVSIKNYYASKSTVEIENLMAQTTATTSTSKLGKIPEDFSTLQQTSVTSTSGKRGQFYMCFSLERMPSETVITTHILDFLEQTLENNIFEDDMSSKATSFVDPTLAKTGEGTDTAESHLVLTAPQDLSAAVVSFPVDVLIDLNVQSSNIRFIAQPHTMVECVLRLPQLRLIATSRRSDSNVDPINIKLDHGDDSGSGQIVYRRSRMDQSSAGVKDDSSTKSAGSKSSPSRRSKQSSSSTTRIDDSSNGGVVVTLILNEFYLSVYHPYNTSGNVSATSTNSNIGTIDRRDALSLSIREIVLDITRSRTALSIARITTSTPLGASFSGLQNVPTTNSVRFSLIGDVSEAKLKQDIRRLPEILAFLKAWYRRTIFRRLFFGEEAPGSQNVDAEPKPSGCAGYPDLSPTLSLSSASSASSVASKSISTGFGVLESDFKKQHKRGSSAAKNMAFSGDLESQAPTTSAFVDKRWEAVVLFGLNFNELSVETMMGHAMGSTSFKISKATSTGYVQVNSEGAKKLHAQWAMGKCEFDARQGMVGGLFSLDDFECYCFTSRAPNSTPAHKFGASVGSVSAKVEWITNTMFIGKVTKLGADFHDIWAAEYHPESRRPHHCSVRLHGLLGWDEMSVMITKVTLSDFLRIYRKLHEVFRQQLDNSRVFLLAESTEFSNKKRNLAEKREKSPPADHKRSQTSTDSDHLPIGPRKDYHFWHKSLDLITRIQMVAKSYFPVPDHSTIVGGSLEFDSKCIDLACFHGINFISEKWFIFHMLELNARFSVDSSYTSLDRQLHVKVEQNLTLKLGHERLERSKVPIATIMRVSRSRSCPIFVSSTDNVDKWLQYAFTTVLNDADTVSRTASEMQRSNHLITFLCKVPNLRFNLRTEQTQATHGDLTPCSTTAASVIQQSQPPICRCACKADGDDYVLITKEIEAFLDIGAMIRAYLQEPEAVGAKPTAPSGIDAAVLDTTKRLQNDQRQYLSDEWEVNVLMNFIALGENAAKDEWIRVDRGLEKGAEYLLGLVGFKDPRVTIPKWIQRGVNDHLDQLLASIAEQILLLSSSSKK